MQAIYFKIILSLSHEINAYQLFKMKFPVYYFIFGFYDHNKYKCLNISNILYTVTFKFLVVNSAFYN